ncbi:MAG: class I SAM-dependent RNA methyltransferase [Deltaproteobacteria bacterium]|nr:class I SAM-dependent RNA methyltransferase [Deltaproteobacteria bacterium]
MHAVKRRRDNARGGRRPTPAGARRTLDARIEELAPGGDAVAIVSVEGERRAIFTPGLLPGEEATLEVDLSTRPARGKVVSLTKSSPDRVTPTCRWVDTCGGCDFMFASDEARRREHGALVARLLPAAFAHVAVEMHAASRTLGYRIRARVHVEARGATVRVGMFGRGTHEPVPVESCVVLDPRVEAARLALASLLAGARGRADVHLALGAKSPVVEVRFRGDALPPHVFARAEELVRLGAVAGIRLWEGDVKIPATIGDPTPWMQGADDLPLELGPGGFSQASEEGNRALARRAVDLAFELSPDPAAPVLELYAGAGNLTVLLAKERSVTAVEVDAGACAAARRNLATRGLAKSARVVEGDAATFPIPRATKLLVLDPPRTGAKEIARALAQRPVPAVVYVSCDPVTLARDLAVLADAGYALRAVEAFEMFPQTSHVETIAALEWSRR